MGVHQKSVDNRKPKVGTVVSTVIADWNLPASVCLHGDARKPMCTLIPVETDPYWILSCWGNGPGITCFLHDYKGGRFYDVLIVDVRASCVVGVALEPHPEDFELDEPPKNPQQAT